MTATDPPQGLKPGDPIPEDKQALLELMNRLVEIGIIKTLRGDEDAPPPSALTAAMSRMDGKGTKNENSDLINPYDHDTVEAARSQGPATVPPVDVEGEDRTDR